MIKYSLRILERQEAIPPQLYNIRWEKDNLTYVAPFPHGDGPTNTPPTTGNPPPGLQTDGTEINTTTTSSHNATEPTSSPPSHTDQKVQLTVTYFGLWTLPVH